MCIAPHLYRLSSRPCCRECPIPAARHMASQPASQTVSRQGQDARVLWKRERLSLHSCRGRGGNVGLGSVPTEMKTVLWSHLQIKGKSSLNENGDVFGMLSEVLSRCHCSAADSSLLTLVCSGAVSSLSFWLLWQVVGPGCHPWGAGCGSAEHAGLQLCGRVSCGAVF